MKDAVIKAGQLLKFALSRTQVTQNRDYKVLLEEYSSDNYLKEVLAYLCEGMELEILDDAATEHGLILIPRVDSPLAPNLGQIHRKYGVGGKEFTNLQQKALILITHLAIATSFFADEDSFYNPDLNPVSFSTMLQKLSQVAKNILAEENESSESLQNMAAVLLKMNEKTPDKNQMQHSRYGLIETTLKALIHNKDVREIEDEIFMPNLKYQLSLRHKLKEGNFLKRYLVNSGLGTHSVQSESK